jgi:predicted small integral membrane protein
MIQRLSKCLLLASVAFIYTLIALNNVTDYDSNYQFVRHVLAMDTTFPGNRLMWRAITNPDVHTAFYWVIIGWEIVAGVLCWWAFARMIRLLRAPAAIFARGKGLAVAALTVGLLLWFVAFLGVGAQWFLMWQSSRWSGGQDAAFRLFACLMLILLYVSLPDPDLVTNVEV